MPDTLLMIALSVVQNLVHLRYRLSRGPGQVVLEDQQLVVHAGRVGKALGLHLGRASFYPISQIFISSDFRLGHCI